MTLLGGMAVRRLAALASLRQPAELNRLRVKVSQIF